MKQVKPRRPFSLILLILLVLFFVAFSLARAIQAVQIWEAIDKMLLVSPVYVLLSGVLWAMVSLGLALGLWRGWRNARLGTLPVFLAYTLYAWIDRLALPGYAGRNQNWLFMLGVNLLILAWAAWVVSRRKVKIFFGEMYEQPIPEQSPGSKPLSGDAGFEAGEPGQSD